MSKKQDLVKKGKPIVYKDGKKADMSSANDQWIDGDIIEEEMKYIAKMTEGLTTGTMSCDDDYIDLKNKVIKEMIKDKTTVLKKKLCETAKNKSSIYDHAQMVQDETLKAYHSYVQQIAKDSTVQICFDELTGEYKIDRSPIPVSMNHNTSNGRSYKWHTIDAKTMRQEMKKRGEGIGEGRKNESDATSERILKEVEEKLKAQDKMNKFEEIVIDVKKKTAKKKKKAAKKMVEANKKKSIYDILELSKHETYDSIPPAKRAWITMHAKKQGKDPDKVKAQIKAKMLRIAKKKAKKNDRK